MAKQNDEKPRRQQPITTSLRATRGLRDSQMLRISEEDEIEKTTYEFVEETPAQELPPEYEVLCQQCWETTFLVPLKPMLGDEVVVCSECKKKNAQQK